MKKMFKNIAKTAKTAAINCQTSIAAFHRRAVCGNAGEGHIDTAVKVLIAVVLGAPGAGRFVRGPGMIRSCLL